MAKRRTAAEIIAFHFCSDIADIRDARYQPSKYASQAIYVVGDDYYCAPNKGQRPKWIAPGKAWREIAEYYDRKIYVSEMETS
jgi:hypothetical protein